MLKRHVKQNLHRFRNRTLGW